MAKAIFTLKPNVMNAIIPTFIKWAFLSFIVALVVYGVFFVLNLVGIVDYAGSTTMIVLGILVILVAVVVVGIEVVILKNTTYYFYNTHAISEFKLLKIKTYSVPYSKITNISTQISVWDRLCKAGDVILHSAEDKYPDLKLKYVRNPRKIEKYVYAIVNKTKR